MDRQVSNKELFKLMLTPEEEVPYHLGFQLRGINIKVREKDVLMMVKVVDRLDGNKIAFIQCQTILDCWAYLATACYRTGTPLKFRHDKW